MLAPRTTACPPIFGMFCACSPVMAGGRGSKALGPLMRAVLSVMGGLLGWQSSRLSGVARLRPSAGTRTSAGSGVVDTHATGCNLRVCADVVVYAVAHAG